MSNYYDASKYNHAFLEVLIEKYNKDPKEGKRRFILSYLHTCSLFMGSAFMVTTEVKGKHYFNVTTYLDDEMFNSYIYEEMSVDEVIKIVEGENKYNDYKIDYIQIQTTI